MTKSLRGFAERLDKARSLRESRIRQKANEKPKEVEYLLDSAEIVADLEKKTGRKETIAINKELRKLYPTKLVAFYNSIKGKSKEREIEFTITIQDILDKLEEQFFKCAISDRPIGINKGDVFISVDRIDSKLHYTPDNIQITEYVFNIMKWKLDQEEFIDRCREVVRKFGAS